MPLNEEQNFNQSQLELIQSGSNQYTFPSTTGDYVSLNIFDDDDNYREELLSQIYSTSGVSLPGSFKYITDATDTVRIKPSDILNELGYPTDNYGIDFNFLRNLFFDTIPDLDSSMYLMPRFFVNQISPSRKEVRLLARQLSSDFWPAEDGTVKQGTYVFDDYPLNSNFQTAFKTSVGTLDNTDIYPRYKFNFILNLGNGNMPVINNYAFDNISDADYSSLIIKLNEPLPDNLIKNSYVSIEKELITTQFLSLYYQSDVISVVVGNALEPDTGIELDDNNQDDTYQNYNQLVSNLQDTSFQNILSHISSSEKNLNINFNEFKNHTFFGSAESKLKNFKTKIGKIQNNFYEISSSLGIDSQVSMSGDSNYIKTRRKDLFNDINGIVTTFTPYEKFLYYDAQNSSTASAPGIGGNLAPSTPVTDSNDELKIFSSSYDGFGVVYKHSSKDDAHVDLFTNKYKAQEAPFFNYSGSIYLSFIIKGDEHLSDSNGNVGKLTWNNFNTQHNPPIPQDAFGGGRILNPTITGSKWQRAIFEVSQSHWQPINGKEVDQDTFDFTSAGAGTYWQLLSGSNITGSLPVTVPTEYDTYPEQFSSPEVEVTGSVMPMGELFRIHYKNTILNNTTEATSSFITDVKVTLNNPQYAYPFDYTYQTGSAQWSNWYDTILSSSVKFDSDNIHSLKNNLPDYILRDNNFDELYTFVSMIGEHFDLIRNYIDNYNNLKKVNYNQLDSVPSEMLPTIIKSFGWDVINPFNTDLDGWFSSENVGSNRKTVAQQTYRKILNNLLYIYKTKGTEKSIKALLNCYGYPSDFLPVRMYGGNTTNEGELVLLGGVHQSPRVVTFDAEKSGITNLIGNQSYEYVRDNHYSYNLRNKSLGIPWWKDGAKGDGIEFIYSSKPGLNNQELLISSGSSGNKHLWKLELEKSTDSTKGKLKFYLSNVNTGSVSLSTSNSEVMQTGETLLRNGNLWNVYLSRNTATASNALTQSYNLYAALQDDDKISPIVSASMILSSSANITAFTGTGSFNGNGNLIVGNKTASGSISEIRMWSGSLSASTFKMHVLDKHSVRGNNINDSKNKLIYRFRLNENTRSGSAQIITDSSNPDNIKDFSFTDGTVDSPFRYNKRLIDFYRFGIKSDPVSLSNNDRINIDDDQYYFNQNLSPNKPSLIDVSAEGGRKTTNKIDISVSITDSIDKKILTEIGGFDITDKFASPKHQKITSGSKYPKLESLRDSILKNVTIDQNKFVRAYKNVFNNAMVNNIKKVLPASSTLNTVGVVIKQDLLDRVKVQKGPKKISREQYHPLSASISNMFDTTAFIEKPLLGDVSGSEIGVTSELNYTNDGLINVMTSSLGTTSNLVHPHNGSIDVSNALNIVDSNIFNNLEDLIDIDDISLSGSINEQHLGNINVFSSSFSAEYLKPFDAEINPIQLGFESSIIKPITGSIVEMFNSNVTISETLNDNVFEANYNIFTGSFISAEKLSPITDTIDIFSDNSVESSLIFPIVGNDIHLVSSSFVLSGSYLSPLLGSIGTDDSSVYSVSSEIMAQYTNTNSYIISESLLVTGELNTSYNTDILIVSESSTLTSEILFPIYGANLNVASTTLTLSSSYQSPLIDTIDTNEIYNVSSDVLYSPVNGFTSLISESLQFSSSIISPYNMSFDMNSIHTPVGSVVNPHSASVSLFDLNQRIHGKEYIPGYGYINHGKGLNDVHYTHALDASQGNHNTYKVDMDYVISAIGDVEVQSGSISELSGSEEYFDGQGSGSYIPFTTNLEEIDHTNIHAFKNRKIISSSTIYKSYVNGGDGIQYGTPVGRTTYFSASADGTIYYPINHEINFHNSKQQLRHLYYKKNNENVTIVERSTGKEKPNQELGLGEFRNGYDTVPSASVYSIGVTGTDTTRLRVSKIKKNK